MSDLIQIPGRPSRRDGPVYDGWTVNGIHYAHSAAKFWPRLIDEARAAFPSCRSIGLTAPGAGPMTAHLLHPERALERNLQRWARHDLRRAMEETVAELELFGVPAGVRLRVPADADLPAVHEQTLDAVDEEVFANLMAWLLEWGGIAASLWNQEFIHGEFEAEDPQRQSVCSVTYDVRNRFLSEDLYQRSVRVAWPEGSSLVG